ncbi:MAG: hypothetical protein K0Q83_738 [Deltaproteobacteria bacterium]|jgi:hypothetical protein|nr:hypothetical protein [Deltaproteobacteria bacterium]
MQNHYSYQSTLAASERIGWKVEDLIGGEKKLDFTKPFMPESLAQVKQLSFLTPQEQLILNQIRGHEYLSMFGLVEEFILPYVVDHARPQLSGDDYRVRALLQFAGEEAKHIHLFKRFRQEFEDGFGSKCDFIGPAEDVSRFVLSHSPLGAGIAILHIEWITLRHYIEGVRDSQELDGQFKSLLKNHWLEESQHTKLDTLMVEEVVANATAKEVDQAFAEYAEIGAFLDNGIQQQAEFDVESFVQATGRDLSRSEREQVKNAVLKGMRWTYLGTGMTHPNFLATVEAIKPEARKQIEEMAPAFC